MGFKRTRHRGLMDKSSMSKIGYWGSSPPEAKSYNSTQFQLHVNQDSMVNRGVFNCKTKEVVDRFVPVLLC